MCGDQGVSALLEYPKRGAILKKKFCLLAFIGALLLALSVPAAAADTVAYISYTDGANTNDGLTPSTPKKTWGTFSGSGVMSLLEDGGTLVVVGKGYVGLDYSMPAMSDTLTITSVYGGVDYKNSLPVDNPACAFKLLSGATLTINSDVVFDDIILFQQYDQNTIVVASGATLTVTDSVVFQAATGLDYHYKIVVESGATAILSEEALSVFTIDNQGGTVETYGDEEEPEPEPEPSISLEDLLEYANCDAYLYYRVGTSSVSENCGAFSDGVGYSLISSSGDLPSSGSMLRTLRVLVPVSIVGDGSYLFNYCFTILSSTSKYANSWTSDGGSIVVHYVDGTTNKISINGSVASTDGLYASLTKSSVSDSYGSSVNVITSLFSASFVVSDPDIIGFEVIYTGTSSTSSTADGGLYKINSEPMSIVNVTDATLSDVVTELSKVVVATQSSSSSISSSVSSAMKEIANTLQSSSKGQTEAIQASLEELRTAIQEVTKTMAAAVEEGTENALEKFYDKVKQEASDKLSAALAQIQEAMPVDITALQGSVNQLYKSVSTHDTSAIMTFPAGELTLEGQTYRFWEPQEIAFDQFFEIPGVSLLLIPLRFMFVWGMAKYLMAYFSKLEKLITLHTGGGGE